MALKGKSNYARHQKRPYRYSDIYRAWKRAIERGDFHAAAHHSIEHRKAFGPHLSRRERSRHAG